MITINKEATSIADAVNMTTEQFEKFGATILETCEGYAEELMNNPENGISRLDFLEKLATVFSEEELLLMALTSFENNLQQVIQFKQQEANDAAQAEAKEDMEAIDYATVMTAEEATMTVVQDIEHEEVPANPETPDPIV